MKILSSILLCLVCWISLSHSIKRRYIGVGEPKSSQNRNAIDFEDKWFLQKLDHFNPINNITWKQVLIINKNK